MMMAAIDTTTARPVSRFKARTCTECGSEFTPAADHAECCSTECRKAFNNRRMTRGAVLYDLFMCIRYERALATKLKLWLMLCRLAWDFRRLDHIERDGRNSWRDPRKVLDERPYLHSIVVARNYRGGR